MGVLVWHVSWPVGANATSVICISCHSAIWLKTSVQCLSKSANLRTKASSIMPKLMFPVNKTKYYYLHHIQHKYDLRHSA